MSLKTYRGSCHCKKVTFEADLDLAKGTGKCNCSICWKTRWWSALIKPDAFRLLTSQDEMLDYTTGAHSHKVFCKHCGVRPYGWGHLPEVGGDYVSINLACMDDLDPAELVAAPLTCMDGRANSWRNPPAEMRHL